MVTPRSSSMEEKHFQHPLYFVLLLFFKLVGAQRSEPSTCKPQDHASSFISLPSSACFPFMLAFGDSLTDIGNNLYSPLPQPSARWPYGETYFHRATGRYSDGRLITDFIQQTLGLPLLDTYLDPTGNVTNGKVFADAGATAMDLHWLARRGIQPSTSNSLDVQIEWFRKYKTALCRSLHLNTTQCNDYFSHALYFFGEIGGNDLNYPLFLGRSISEVSTYIPHIIQKINATLETLIQEGARTLIVEGAPPVGCTPVFIQTWNERAMRDSSRGCCLSTLNELSQQHNVLLQEVVNSLGLKYPAVQFLYFDFYEAFYDVLENAESEGITNTWEACYDTANSFHPTTEAQVRESSVRTLCPHPEAYASWDGLHLTEAMYRAIARRLLMRAGFQTPFPNFVTQRCNMRFPDVEGDKGVEAD